MEDLELLERSIRLLDILSYVAERGYFLSTNELKLITGVQSNVVTAKAKKNGDSWVWRNWVFTRLGRSGSQLNWSVEWAEKVESSQEFPKVARTVPKIALYPHA